MLPRFENFLAAFSILVIITPAFTSLYNKIISHKITLVVLVIKDSEKFKESVLEAEKLAENYDIEIEQFEKYRAFIKSEKSFSLDMNIFYIQ